MLISFFIFALISNLLILTIKKTTKTLFSTSLVRICEDEGSQKTQKMPPPTQQWQWTQPSIAWQFLSELSFWQLQIHQWVLPPSKTASLFVYLLPRVERWLFSQSHLPQQAQLARALKNEFLIKYYRFRTIFLWFDLFHWKHNKHYNVDFDKWNTMILWFEIVDAMVNNDFSSFEKFWEREKNYSSKIINCMIVLFWGIWTRNNIFHLFMCFIGVFVC